MVQQDQDLPFLLSPCPVLVPEEGKAHLFIGVSQRIDSDSRREIQVLSALRVPNETTLSLIEDERRSVVGRKKAFGLGLEEGHDVGGSGEIRVGRKQVGLVRLSTIIRNQTKGRQRC